jgi:hypothetical protein
MSEFTVGGTDFLLDGRPVRLLSGALHYFRVHEAQWGHRLAMLRAMGLNRVGAGAGGGAGRRARAPAACPGSGPRESARDLVEWNRVQGVLGVRA